MTSSKFLKDLNTGSKGEALVAALLLKIGIDSELSNGDPTFDLKHTKPVNFMSEVKFDIYAARSGNIAVEFYNPKQGKSSGINITAAQLWFHVVAKPMSIWVTTVKRLKEYINKEKPYRVIECGGDNNASMYLYRQNSIFNDIFQRIDNCSVEELSNIILKLLI